MAVEQTVKMTHALIGKDKQVSVLIHTQKLKYRNVPIGVQWLVTGVVPSKVPFCTLNCGY